MITYLSRLLICLLFLTSNLFAKNYIPDSILREKIDSVENNFFYDENGRLVFQQLIWRDWNEKEGRYDVRAWRLVKDNSILPKRNWETNTYDSFWLDGENLRFIKVKNIDTTHYQFDIELIERESLPKEKRKELFIPKIKK